MFAFIVTTIFTSCSKDEEFDPLNPKLLVGNWLYEKYDNIGRFVSSEEYYFGSNGGGFYHNSYNTKGSFDYKVNNNDIIFKMDYSVDNGKYFHVSHFSYKFYFKSRDTLFIDAKKYIRQGEYKYY